MENNFVVYKRFDDVALAENFVEFLKDNHIEYLVEENALSFDPTFARSRETAIEYAVKIAPANFEKVNAMLVVHEDATLGEIDPDHYLLKFTNDELTDVLVKADEWSATDYALASRLLIQRGVKPSNEDITRLKQQRFNELKRPATVKTGWLLAGYFVALLGGVAGVLMGWLINHSKNTLPNGEQTYAYDDNTRQHGNRIFILGIICFILAICLKVYEGTQ